MHLVRALLAAVDLVNGRHHELLGHIVLVFACYCASNVPLWLRFTVVAVAAIKVLRCCLHDLCMASSVTGDWDAQCVEKEFGSVLSVAGPLVRCVVRPAVVDGIRQWNEQGSMGDAQVGLVSESNIDSRKWAIWARMLSLTRRGRRWIGLHVAFFGTRNDPTDWTYKVLRYTRRILLSVLAVHVVVLLLACAANRYEGRGIFAKDATNASGNQWMAGAADTPKVPLIYDDDAEDESERPFSCLLRWLRDVLRGNSGVGCVDTIMASIKPVGLYFFPSGLTTFSFMSTKVPLTSTHVGQAIYTLATMVLIELLLCIGRVLHRIVKARQVDPYGVMAGMDNPCGVLCENDDYEDTTSMCISPDGESRSDNPPSVMSLEVVGSTAGEAGGDADGGQLPAPSSRSSPATSTLSQQQDGLSAKVSSDEEPLCVGGLSPMASQVIVVPFPVEDIDRDGDSATSPGSAAAGGSPTQGKTSTHDKDGVVADEDDGADVELNAESSTEFIPDPDSPQSPLLRQTVRVRRSPSPGVPGVPRVRSDDSLSRRGSEHVIPIVTKPQQVQLISGRCRQPRP